MPPDCRGRIESRLKARKGVSIAPRLEQGYAGTAILAEHCIH